MVFKSASVLACLLPTRLGFSPTQRPDPPSPGYDQEKHAEGAQDHLDDPGFDPFRGNTLAIHPHSPADQPDISRARANTAPSDSLSPPFIPDGGIGESPTPVHRSLVPPVRQKRSSFTTFFAFSSKRRSTHGAPIARLPQLQHDALVPAQSVAVRQMSDADQSQVHLVNPASIPSPLKADDEEYYYSYYTLSTPTFPSRSASNNLGAENRSPSKQPSSQQQDLIGNPDLDSQLSSPVDSHLSHTQIRHPYAYPTPRHPKPYSKIDAGPRLRHASSQPFRPYPQDSYSDANAGPAHDRILSSQLGHDTSKSRPHPLQPELKTSMSTPNLASTAISVHPRSLFRKRPSTRSKGQERWLSAESWWDALFSPSPRFRIKQAPRPTPANKVVNAPVSTPIPSEPHKNLGVTFPSIPAARPRAASVTCAGISGTRPTIPSFARSRSVADLSVRPSTPATLRAGFEPALETLVDQPAPQPDQVPDNDSELPPPDPPLSLEQVLDEGQAFEQQRAQWKQQASKSLGNKHTRSFSRARSKSLGERNIRLARHASESGRAQLNFEFLAARTLLGSQSTMPIVHVTKPTSSSSHSKAHSHSHSAYSCTHSSHSRAYSHSHSHSHSLTTSNSSKSSRNLPPRGHSRNGSWGKTAFLKAGSLCGISQEDSCITDERVPSSSRVDVQGTIVIGHATNTGRLSDADEVSPSPSNPSGSVGIAISSSTPPENSLDLHSSGPQHQDNDRDNRWSSIHSHKSSEYAGPHPSVIDSNLPQLDGASDISLRHRLPPRPAIYPPIAPIAHPYRSARARSEQVGNKGSRGATSSKVIEGQEVMEPGTGCTPYPHISLSHPDFDQYGVGEALVYASFPPPKEIPEAEGESSPAVELPTPQEQHPPSETVVSESEERDISSLAMNTVPSLTSPTIQMVMSAFNSPDDLDEFQDLFYKPTSGGRKRQLSMAVSQVPTDVRSSTSGSPLAHLVRKLSEEVKSLRDPSRTPSDPIIMQRSESQGHRSNQSGTKFVFADLARPSSSPLPMESTSQLHVHIQEGNECTAQPVMVIPEDVNSSCVSSVLESALEDQDNDTFGYPIKHGQLEATTAPSPIQSSIRVSTHLSIQEDGADENETAFLSPVTKRCGLTSVDAVRASYLTTSDVSQMSRLSDFPLPPGVRPLSILQAYFEAVSPLSTSETQERSDNATEMGHGDQDADGKEEGGPSGDVEETLRALRMTPRVVSYESRRSTFGGSDDMDFITELHQAGP